MMRPVDNPQVCSTIVVEQLAGLGLTVDSEVFRDYLDKASPSLSAMHVNRYEYEQHT